MSLCPPFRTGALCEHCITSLWADYKAEIEWGFETAMIVGMAFLLFALVSYVVDLCFSKTPGNIWGVSAILNITGVLIYLPTLLGPSSHEYKREHPNGDRWLLSIATCNWFGVIQNLGFSFIAVGLAAPVIKSLAFLSSVRQLMGFRHQLEGLMRPPKVRNRQLKHVMSDMTVAVWTTILTASLLIGMLVIQVEDFDVLTRQCCNPFLSYTMSEQGFYIYLAIVAGILAILYGWVFSISFFPCLGYTKQLSALVCNDTQRIPGHRVGSGERFGTGVLLFSRMAICLHLMLIFSFDVHDKNQDRVVPKLSPNWSRGVVSLWVLLILDVAFIITRWVNTSRFKAAYYNRTTSFFDDEQEEDLNKDGSVSGNDDDNDDDNKMLSEDEEDDEDVDKDLNSTRLVSTSSSRPKNQSQALKSQQEDSDTKVTSQSELYVMDMHNARIEFNTSSEFVRSVRSIVKFFGTRVKEFTDETAIRTRLEETNNLREKEILLIRYVFTYSDVYYKVVNNLSHDEAPEFLRFIAEGGAKSIHRLSEMSDDELEQLWIQNYSTPKALARERRRRKRESQDKNNKKSI